MVTLESIQAAATRLKDVIYHSPCPYSLTLSRLCGCDIYCKLDHLQMTGSFKERGARNKLELLPKALREKGVIAASAGNHALALAYHGQLLGISVVVVMPKWAPLVKVSNCRGFGAEVLLQGESFADAYSIAKKMAAETGRTFIPGFDDPDIIAGAGTMGLEIVEDVPDADAVVVPVGGGGLLAGVGTAIKALRPTARVIGVESVKAPTLLASMKAGQITRIDTQPTLADGLAVAELGKQCFEPIQHSMDDLVMVDEPQVALAILRLMELEKMVVEGAGAVSLAAVMNRPPGLAGKKVVLCLTGGNIDVTVISRIIERGLSYDGRLCRVIVYISDRPGSLATLLTLVAQTGASIKEVSHDRSFGPADVARVKVSVIMETRDLEHIREIHKTLKEKGVEIVDSSHVRQA